MTQWLSLNVHLFWMKSNIHPLHNRDPVVDNIINMCKIKPIRNECVSQSDKYADLLIPPHLHPKQDKAHIKKIKMLQHQVVIFKITIKCTKNNFQLRQSECFFYANLQHGTSVDWLVFRVGCHNKSWQLQNAWPSLNGMNRVTGREFHLKNALEKSYFLLVKICN